MNEKEIIEILENYDNEDNLIKIHKAIQGILDLYKAEKEKNKELETAYLIQRDLINGDYIAKSKIKAKIEKLDKANNGYIMSFHYPVVKKVLQSLLEEE